LLNTRQTAISAAVSKQTNRLLVIAIPIVFCAASPPSIAHHSHAEFSEEIIQVDGELTRIVWSNPHPAMTLKTLDANGEEQIVRLQILGNVNGMNRDGVTSELFHQGQQVKITGQLSLRREGLMLANFAEFEDGSRAALGPYTSAQGAIYGNSNSGDTAIPEDSAPSLFHVWTVESRTRNYEPPLRANSQAIKDSWDPIQDDVQANCSPLGMPGAMMSPHPIEFVDQGDSILLRLEEWDASRRIYMNDNQPESLETSRMGISYGQWDGSSLLVRTTDTNYPFLDEYGTPQSSSVEFLELFTLSNDAGWYLDWSVRVTDLETFSAPFELSTTRWQWLPGETLQPYECQDLESLFNG